MKIAAFASGNGSNVSALIKKGIKIDLIVCNKQEAYVIKRAQAHNVKCIVIPTANRSPVDFEQEMLKALKAHDIELILLAGYMRLIGSTLLGEYEGRILNIHPSLLPAFKGAHAIKEAYEYGVKVSGVTVHYIDSKMDEGTIVMQRAVEIEDTDSLSSFEQKIHEVEYELYYKAVNKVIKERNEKSVS